MNELRGEAKEAAQAAGLDIDRVDERFPDGGRFMSDMAESKEENTREKISELIEDATRKIEMVVDDSSDGSDIPPAEIATLKFARSKAMEARRLAGDLEDEGLLEEATEVWDRVDELLD